MEAKNMGYSHPKMATDMGLLRRPKTWDIPIPKWLPTWASYGGLNMEDCRNN